MIFACISTGIRAFFFAFISIGEIFQQFSSRNLKTAPRCFQKHSVLFARPSERQGLLRKLLAGTAKVGDAEGSKYTAVFCLFSFFFRDFFCEKRKRGCIFVLLFWLYNFPPSFLQTYKHIFAPHWIIKGEVYLHSRLTYRISKFIFKNFIASKKFSPLLLLSQYFRIWNANCPVERTPPVCLNRIPLIINRANSLSLSSSFSSSPSYRVCQVFDLTIRLIFPLVIFI